MPARRPGPYEKNITHHNDHLRNDGGRNCLFAAHPITVVSSQRNDIQSDDTFTVDVTLTYAGYSAYGLSYWLEVAGGTQSFFHITAQTFLVFNDPNHTGWPNEFSFPMTNGVDAGMFATHNDLGATTQPLVPVPAGTYLVSHISFSITGAAPGVYTFYSTSTLPRPSTVTDTDFNDNAIPRAAFTIATVVPEPTTFALLALTGAGLGLLAYRRTLQP